MEMDTSSPQTQTNQHELCFHRLLKNSFALNKNLQEKLNDNKIKLASEIRCLTDEQLIAKKFTHNEVREINEKIKSIPAPICFTFSQWKQRTCYISTGCEGFDHAFGGKGLPTGRLVQISGEAGAGKSQICMQLCFRAQLSIEKGGLDADSIYLDTEDAFRPDRISQMASYYFGSDCTDKILLNYKAEEVLTRIHMRRIKTSADDLFNIILNGQLDSFFEYHSNVKLLILDSIAYHFRYDYDNKNSVRVHQLVKIASKLKQIAFQRNIAMVITNQVRFDNFPVLGPIWNSLCSTSLLLNRVFTEEIQAESTNLRLSHRQCSVLKSPNIPHDYSFSYYITPNGIEDS